MSGSILKLLGSIGGFPIGHRFVVGCGNHQVVSDLIHPSGQGIQRCFIQFMLIGYLVGFFHQALGFFHPFLIETESGLLQFLVKIGLCLLLSLFLFCQGF
jgi:hypothetical protein